MLTVPAAIILSGATGVAVGVILYENRDLLKEQFLMARQKVAMALHELADSIAEEHQREQQQQYRQRGRQRDGNGLSEDDDDDEEEEKATSASTISGNQDTSAARKRIVRRYHDFENDNPEFGLNEKVQEDLLGDSIENATTVVPPPAQEETGSVNVDRVLLDEGVDEEKVDDSEGKTETEKSNIENDATIAATRNDQSCTAESASTDNSYVMDGFYDDAQQQEQQEGNEDYWNRHHVNQWAKQTSLGD